MAYACDICSKGKQYGHNVPFSLKKTNKVWKPNLQRQRISIGSNRIQVKICTAYRRDSGETLTEFPADLSLLEGSEAVYETVPGWQTSTAGVRDFSMLPAAAQRYVTRLSELVGCEIGIVSTGPERNATILRSQSAVASWFD